MPEIGALIASGRVADVHFYGEHAVKLYHPPHGKTQSFNEAAILGMLESHNLPVPCVHEAGRYGGRWGIVMDLVAGDTLGQRVQSDLAGGAAVLEEIVRLQLLVNETTETRLRPLKVRLAANIGDTRLLSAADKDRLLEFLGRLPDGDRLCHGDFHPFNVIGDGSRAVIIDWLDATTGAPAADACRSYLLLRLGAPEFAESYLDLYCAHSGVERSEVLDWLPCVAAARLNEGVARDEQFLIELATSG
jgi:aminoglycoside phosphotransferase (APT) family kinase protein